MTRRRGCPTPPRRVRLLVRPSSVVARGWTRQSSRPPACSWTTTRPDGFGSPHSKHCEGQRFQRPSGQPGGLSVFLARKHNQQRMGVGDPMFAPQTETEIDALASELASSTHWWGDARCNDLAGTMSGLFFSEELQDIARAKAICAKCPVIAECLEGALERREPRGQGGGQLFRTGHDL